MAVKICADSTCDLSPELVKKYNITLTTNYVTMEGKAYRDGVTVTPAEIFAFVAAGKGLPTTSAVNTADYLEVFGRYSKEYDAVIQITIGSGFSCCYQNASVAAKSFDNVFVVDSWNLSTGQGLLVVKAAEMAQNGSTAQEILACMEELRPKVEASFLIDRLDYMQKGGRCSMVTLLGANLLHLKPCIEVISNQMKVVEKFRGPYVRCIREYCEKRLNGREDIRPERIFITHTGAESKVVAAAKDVIAKDGRFGEVLETIAGCTVSCHCGPNTLGILFIRK